MRADRADADLILFITTGSESRSPNCTSQWAWSGITTHAKALASPQSAGVPKQRATANAAAPTSTGRRASVAEVT